MLLAKTACHGILQLLLTPLSWADQAGTLKMLKSLIMAKVMLGC
jgi:hypothetical protein